jgi:DUF1680 family protein
MAEYHNLIYYKDASGLYVNLFVPSEVTWGGVKLVQQTKYPEAETTTLTLSMQESKSFTLRFRVPAWARAVRAKVNGVSTGLNAKPGTWASLDRVWNDGDRVEILIPLPLRMVAVDRWHPNRVAVVRGPVVLVLENHYHAAAFRLPERDDDLNRWLVPDDPPHVYRVVPPDGRNVRLKFKPFYEIGEVFPYAMYFDREKLPYALW